MTPQPADPLTPEEEADLRALLDLAGEDATIGTDRAARLLATLDAARTPTPPADQIAALATVLFDVLGWRSRIRIGREIAPYCETCGRGDYSTFDPLPDGILSGDADNVAWTALAARLLAANIRIAAPETGLREALELAHDHHAFGPEGCTPANCSAEAAIRTFATRRGPAGRKPLGETHGESRPRRSLALGTPFDNGLVPPADLASPTAASPEPKEPT